MLRGCLRGNSITREMLLTLATKRLRSMAHVGLTERLDESVVSMAADLGGWGPALLASCVSRAAGGRGRARLGPAREPRAAHTARAIGWQLLMRRGLAGLGTGIDLGGPAYKYTSANAFSYDDGSEDDTGAPARLLARGGAWKRVSWLQIFMGAGCTERDRNASLPLRQNSCLTTRPPRAGST